MFVNDVFDFLRDVAKLCTEYKFSLSCFCFPSECLWSFREVYVVDFLYYLICFVASLFQFSDQFKFHWLGLSWCEGSVLVSPFMIAFLVAVGWYESECTYSCLFVCLICVLMSSMLSLLKRSPL